MSHQRYGVMFIDMLPRYARRVRWLRVTARCCDMALLDARHAFHYYATPRLRCRRAAADATLPYAATAADAMMRYLPFRCTALR